jgi:hypothetical protein
MKRLRQVLGIVFFADQGRFLPSIKEAVIR